MRLSLAALALALVVAQPSTSEAQRCDRRCLGDFITTYLDAMVAHDPERLHVSSRVRFTEDTVEMRLGEGLWKTATALRPYRQDFIDVREGVAGTHTVVEEDGRPVLVALRLKVFGLAISEVESMVVRNRQEGVLFQPDAFTAPNAGMAYAPQKSELDTARRNDSDRIALSGWLARGQFPHARCADVQRRLPLRERAANGGARLHVPSAQLREHEEPGDSTLLV